MIFCLKLMLSTVLPLAIYSCLTGFMQCSQVCATAGRAFARPLKFESVAQAYRQIDADQRLCDYLDARNSGHWMPPSDDPRGIRGE